MAVLRAFIAIDLSADIYEKIDQISDGLKLRLGGLPVRWVPSDNIHLTLKFLGDVSESNLALVKEILGAEAGNHAPFEFSVGGIGVFPNAKRPRVVWVGVESPEELMNLQRRVESETARLGYPAETRPFSPHLTLGRVSRNASGSEVGSISRLLQKEKLGFLGVTRVESLHLYRSELQPGGAVYTKLFTANLGSE